MIFVKAAKKRDPFSEKWLFTHKNVAERLSSYLFSPIVKMKNPLFFGRLIQKAYKTLFSTYFLWALTQVLSRNFFLPAERFSQKKRSRLGAKFLENLLYLKSNIFNSIKISLFVFLKSGDLWFRKALKAKNGFEKSGSGEKRLFHKRSIHCLEKFCNS